MNMKYKEQNFTQKIITYLRLNEAEWSAMQQESLKPENYKI